MKKIMTFLIVLCMVFGVACGQDKSFADGVTCKQILDAALTAQSYDNTTIYDSNNKLDQFTMSMWADGIFGECDEFDLFADYAICYSADNTTYEISVLKLKSKDDSDTAVSLLERRKKTLEGGVKAAYDPDFKQLMQNSKIITDGEFVMLLITADNAEVLEKIENLKQ